MWDVELDPGFGLPHSQAQAVAGSGAASLGPGIRHEERRLPRNGEGLQLWTPPAGGEVALPMRG